MKCEVCGHVPNALPGTGKLGLRYTPKPEAPRSSARVSVFVFVYIPVQLTISPFVFRNCRGGRGTERGKCRSTRSPLCAMPDATRATQHEVFARRIPRVPRGSALCCRHMHATIYTGHQHYSPTHLTRQMETRTNDCRVRVTSIFCICICICICGRHENGGTGESTPALAAARLSGTTQHHSSAGIQETAVNAPSPPKLRTYNNGGCARQVCARSAESENVSAEGFEQHRTARHGWPRSSGIVERAGNLLHACVARMR